MFAMFGDNISEDNMITNIIPMVGNPVTVLHWRMLSNWKCHFPTKDTPAPRSIPKFSTMRVEHL